MSEFKYEEKFFVLNTKKLENIPVDNSGLQDFFIKIAEVVKLYENLIGESVDGKKYYVCNQDEPYSEKVFDIIKQGEKTKVKDD